MMASIFAQTSSHVVAAPMAHFLALEGSRFRFSHDIAYLPAYGMYSILTDAPMVQRYHRDKDKAFVFHSAMYYLHRPEGMESFCMYDFYSKLKIYKKQEAKKQEIEYFEFPKTDNRCFRDHCLVYRETPAVPVFPWTFLKSTKSFTSPLNSQVDEFSPDYHMKEEYAIKFMILFYPFRKIEDLKLDNSFQKQMTYLIAIPHLIPEHLIKIANNIQNLHNSLASTMPENNLDIETMLEEEEELDLINSQQNESNTQVTNSQLITMIEAFALDQESNMMDACVTEETLRVLNPIHGTKFQIGQNALTCSALSIAQLESVVEITEEVMSTSASSNQRNIFARRFVAPMDELNSLLMSTTILVDRTLDNGSSTPNTTKRRINANGSWQSIVLWGMNVGFDEDQQMAFEILASTYVITFFDDAAAPSQRIFTSGYIHF
jgi:hypothetical protein